MFLQMFVGVKGCFFSNRFAKRGSTVNTSNIFQEYIMYHGSTNEINSPGRTTNQLPEFRLADSFFSSHVGAWKIPVSNEEMYLEKLGFYCL